MKLIIDGIIENLQNGGGCTVYFEQLLSLYQNHNNNLDYIKFRNSHSYIGLAGQNTHVHDREMRVLERWRDVDTADLDSEAIFHSTHYRLPISKRKHKIVTTVHDFTYEYYRTGPSQWLHSWQKNRAIRNSDLVICISKNTATDLMRFCAIDESKIRIVHNGVSPVYYPLVNIAKTNEVLFVGARGGYKNFLLVAEALASVPDLELSIVGGGALTEKEVATLNQFIPGRFKHLGRVTDEELNQIYNRVFCLLYPSAYEGFGIPVIEAMRSGCPVIAVNKSSIPEISGDAAYLLEKASAGSISAALNELKSSSVCQLLIQKGLVQASHFSWKKCYEETSAVYKELY
ncbi:glycosyltransferase family 4 protein [Ewingella americana]|uniref:Mannosyltransferase n=1 Tax=Ewingella americana (strain ATCC 33852 / DSM 4580 / CCUG 14506 / JCM 5911 / LMG 7869 / NCTC 12157 / CDC 1468-78) TaxID=910964 RepID=A0A085GHC3_EWIA3|nr:glycosyltransferase family 1 protein [Ewingella americana]KAA8729506.1 glycosyltransferase family 4 protein [Ewingella americana]KFC83118.1 mannosyltransferase [Ewingella americana ATCC 33852]